MRLSVSLGSTARELGADTKVLGRMTLPAGDELVRIAAWMDGLGAGSGDQAVKAIAYNTAGTAVLATGTAVTITDGQTLGLVEFPLVVPLGLGPTDVIFGLLAGGPGTRSARIWGDNFAAPIVNLVTNPSIEINTTGWQGSHTISRDTSWATSGAACLRSTGVANSNDVSAFSPPFTVAPGQKVSARAGWKVGAANTASGASAGPRMGIQWDDGSGQWNLGGGGTFTPTQAMPAIGTVGTVSIANATVPTLATRARIRLLGATTGSQTVELLWDSVIAVFGTTVPAYGDGSLPGWGWDGTAHASTSRGPLGGVNYVRDPYARGPLGAGQKWVPTGGTNVTALAGSFITNDPNEPTMFEATGTFGGNTSTDFFSAQARSNTASEYAPVTPGQTLYARVRAYAPTRPAGSILHARIDWRNSAGGFITSTDVPSPTPGALYEWNLSSVAPDGAVWANIEVVLNNNGAAGGAGAGVIRATKAILSPTNIALFDPSASGNDWLGVADASASIQWQLPEVYDAYTDGPASSTGLTPAAAKLPAIPFAADVTGRRTSLALSTAPAVSVACQDTERVNVTAFSKPAVRVTTTVEVP